MKKALYFILSLSILMLTSCKNFMDAGNVQKEIQNMINEANAKSVKFVITQDNTMGTFLSSGDKECKLGYSIDVQFNLKKESYIFKGIKAVSTNDAEDSRDDCIEFTITDRDDDKGIYKIEIKVVKDASDILIIPDCILVPGVVKEECFPSFDASGWEQDSTIRIAFNKPVTTQDSFTISIVDTSGLDMTQYYDEPYFSTDKMTLFIPTLPKNLNKRIIKDDDTIQTKDLIVKFDLSDIKDEEGMTGSGLFEYKFRLKKACDTNPPTISSVAVYTSSNKTKEISPKNYSQWSASGDNYGDYGTYHINKSIYIEFDAYDEGSGIQGLCVDEKIIKYSDGSSGDSSSKPVIKDCTIDSETGKFVCQYTIASLYDGIIELDIHSVDNSENKSTQSYKYYVLKDTIIDSSRVKFKEEKSELSTIQDWLDNVPVLDNTRSQNVSITLKDNVKDVFYSDANLTCSSKYDIRAYWGQDSKAITNPISINANNVFTFTRDPSQLTYIKICCKDSVGNEKAIIKRMDPIAEFENFSAPENDQVTFIEDMMSIKNSDSLKILCNRDIDNSDFVTICKFILEYTYKDSNDNEQTIISVINGQLDFARTFKENFFYAFEENTAPADFPNPCTVKSYFTTTFGDFPSPRSISYIEGTYRGTEIFTFNPEDPYSPTEERPVWNPNNHLVTPNSSNTGSTATNVVYAYGPNDSTPYINDKLKIKEKVQLNRGCCLVTVSDYQTLQGKTANAKYRFVAELYDEEYVDSSEGAEPFTSKDPPVYYRPNYFNRTFESENPSFYLPTPGIYKIYVEATVDDTIYKPLQEPETIQDNAYTLEPREGFDLTINNETTETEYLFLEHDATPPYVKGTDVLSLSSSSCIIGIPEEDFSRFSSGPYKNERNKCELSYYPIPSSTNDLLSNFDFTLEELQEYYSDYEIKWEYSGQIQGGGYSIIQVPYGRTDEGFNVICIVAKDNAGNYTIKTFKGINTIIGKLNYTRSELPGSDITFPLKQGDTLKIDDCSQIPEPYMLDGYSCPEGEETGEFVLRDEYTNDGWYKAQIFRGAYNRVLIESEPLLPVSEYGSSYAEYFYVGQINGSNWSCIEALNGGLQFFCDTPVLIHTMFSFEKLTDSKDSEDACLIWETKGIETGLLINSDNFTYGQSNIIDVQKGAYYTTIAHFVDGSVIMTDIKQKE